MTGGGTSRFPPIKHAWKKESFFYSLNRSCFGPQFPLALLTFSVGLKKQVAFDLIPSDVEV